ncbi:hypothetical protein F5Y15DRAFT_56523 [Xylariaceae sp. FL0016]|nr:hypothetical protein F5Y15DRAFT_56523 [Xylariaceae sp. FL0016]
MDASDLDSGLFGIQLSDSEDSSAKDEAPARNAQSEEAFQKVKKQYKVKAEDGEPESQATLHAVEELYFFGRFEEGAAFASVVLNAESDGRLDEDTRKMMRYYEKKCIEKAGNC